MRGDDSIGCCENRVALRHTHILRAAHAEPLGGAAREIEPRALPVGGAPRAGVVDAHGERAAVLRIGDGQAGAERPGARGGGVAVGIEALAGRGALARGVMTGENFLPAGAIARRLHVTMHRASAARLRGLRTHQRDGAGGKAQGQAQ